jgi:hypothetical protein
VLPFNAVEGGLNFLLHPTERKIVMLSEFQPTIINFCCHCGAALLESENWSKPKWEDDTCWSGCNHEAANHEEDPELQEIEDEMDEIIERINKSTQKINALSRKGDAWIRL